MFYHEQALQKHKEQISCISEGLNDDATKNRAPQHEKGNKQKNSCFKVLYDNFFL